MIDSHLPDELHEWHHKIRKIATDYGLDFFPVVFEMVDYKQINAIAAYGGFPVRYPHWHFGMQFEQLQKSYDYGLSKIYELVINTNPVYAYLLKGNLMMDQKLVMAHVYGHADFFKNNQWFAPTNKKMMDTMANHATRIRQYIDRFGRDRVESFIDKCLTLENLIDRYSPYIVRTTDQDRLAEKQRVQESLRNRGILENYSKEIRPDLSSTGEETPQKEIRFPSRPEKDILLFLIHYAPLETWQQDVLSIIRDEAYYFAPQGMTKIMNEGWASYWHSKMMTKNIMDDREVVTYADHHAGAMAMDPMGFNPYKIGIELFRNIEDRWNKGQFGKEWEDCDSFEMKRSWDKKTGLGRQKIFQIRRDYNDINFIREFLTEDFCIEHKIFVWNQDQQTGQRFFDPSVYPKMKQKLLFQLTNGGHPVISLVEANFEGRGELLLEHLHEGMDLQMAPMQETMKNLAYLWGRPVNMKTTMDEVDFIYRWDGKEFEKNKIGESVKLEEVAET